MARLYSNENFPLQVVQALRVLGHDVMTVREAGKSNKAIPYDEVLGFAHAESRAILTINRKHFIRLYRDGAQHSGIVVCTFDTDFQGQAERIHAAISELPSLDGQLVRVNRPQT